MIDIQITAEELVRAALKRYITAPSAPDHLLAETIRDIYPNTNGEMVRTRSLENSIAKGVKKIIEDDHEWENKFLAVGQMSLFGDLIPEHKIPSRLLDTSVRETLDWMETRARIEQENADELRRAADAQQRKAERFAKWLSAVLQVYQSILEAGMNPETITYAQAIKHAETPNAQPDQGIGQSPKQPVR